MDTSLIVENFLLIALMKLAVLEDVADNSLPDSLASVAVDVTIVAVIVLAIFLINAAVDVDVADKVLNKVSNLLIVAVVADVTENVLRYFNTLEMVLVLVEVADNVGVRVIVSRALIATLFTLDPFIAIS
jgi:hypothetical protein